MGRGAMFFRWRLGAAITARQPMFKVRAFAIIAAVALLAPGGAKAFAASGPSIAALRAAGAAEVRDVYVRVPRSNASIPVGQPMQVLVTLHGMGGNGAD